jgi:adenylate cyclase
MMNIRHAALLCAFLFSALTANAQSNLPRAVADSLWAVWADPAKPDTARLNAIDRYGRDGYMFTLPDSALHFARIQFGFAEQKGLRDRMARALYLQGAAQSILGESDSALYFYNRSIALIEGSGDGGMASTVYNAMGTVHSSKGEYAKAIKYFTESLRIRDAARDTVGRAAALRSIGNVFYAQADYEKAREYYLSALELAELAGHRKETGAALVGIGNIHYALEEDSTALGYYLRFLEIAQELGDDHGTAYALGNIGTLYQAMERYDEAVETHGKSLALRERIGDREGLTMVLYNMALIRIDQGQWRKAIELGDRSLKVAGELGYVLSLRNSAEVLWKAHRALGQHDRALSMHELYITMRDSILNEESQREVMRMQFQYDFDKKEALLAAEQEKKDAIAAEQLKRKNQQRNAFMGGFVLMLGLAGVSYRSYRQKQRDNVIITREKARSDELLLNILPHEVAEELKDKGHADAKLIDHATVLFTDFKGFTQLSETLSPSELVADLNECFSAFDRICGKYGIEKIKTIGDAYMAAGGLPTPNRTHPRDVVMAALEMAAFISEGKARKMAVGKTYFDIRIGIHTGPVVAGIVGIKKFQYDIWGDTVNTASRMESSGEVGKVNISEATYELVKDDFHCEFRGEIEAKGKGKMGMYFVSLRSAT